MDSQPTAKAMHSGFATEIPCQWHAGTDHCRPHQHRRLPATPTIREYHGHSNSMYERDQFEADRILTELELP